MAAAVVVAGALAIGVVHLAVAATERARAQSAADASALAAAAEDRAAAVAGRRGQRRAARGAADRRRRRDRPCPLPAGHGPGPGSPGPRRGARRLGDSRERSCRGRRALIGPNGPRAIAPGSSGWSRRLGPRAPRRSPCRSPRARRRGAVGPPCVGGRARRPRDGSGPGGRGCRTRWPPSRAGGRPVAGRGPRRSPDGAGSPGRPGTPSPANPPRRPRPPVVRAAGRRRRATSPAGDRQRLVG